MNNAFVNGYLEGYMAKQAEKYIPENDMPVVSKAERAQDAKNMVKMQAEQKKNAGKNESPLPVDSQAAKVTTSR